MEPELDIYTLVLNESIKDGGWVITKVPGGWIYSDYERNDGTTLTSCFVPFNNEFQEEK